MKSESVSALARSSAGALARSPAVASSLPPRPLTAPSSRSLSTARAVLRVLALLGQRPDGIRADEVAQALGKSLSTAYYLLTSLCEEGFARHESKGVYRPAEVTAATEGLTPAAARTPQMHPGIADAVDDLFLLTRKRSYLGVVRAGRIEIVAVRGRQGVPRMPGLGSEIRDSAHALAMGKVVLSLLGPRGLSHYIAGGLKSFTAQTITTAAGLEAELERVRRDGFAVDREELDESFCCVAAPIFDERRRLVAALGLSMTPHVFDTDLERLSAIVIQVAEIASSCEKHQVLETRST